MSPPQDLTITLSPSSLNDPLPTQTHELFFARRALKLLKDRLGPSGLQSLLAPDILVADAYWSEILRKSQETYQLASVTLTAPHLQTSDFLAWFKTNVPDLGVMQAAHPEHYLNGTTVLETIGEHVSFFTLEFVDEEDLDFGVVKNRDREKFPVALCARGRLRSGEVVGHALHQFRDLGGGKGMECCFSGWLPSAVDEETVEMQKRHLVVEWTNWIRAAWEDPKRKGGE